MAANMYVAAISLTHFRNHTATAMEPGSGLVILTGENGAGKTNILEAVSLLAPGRGLRGVAMVELIQDGAPDGFAVSAQLRDADVASNADLSPIQIGTGVTRAAPGRRRVRINGSDAAATALGEWLSVLWLTPAMDRLFIEAASQRRRFLDRMTLALDPRHAHHASRYDAALKARGKLLSGDVRPDPHWLDALEAQLADHGTAIDHARHALISRMQMRLASEPDGPFARPTLSLIGPDGAPSPPWEQEELRHRLSVGRARDAAAGRALEGPHRVDLSVTHALSGQAAARCSTGEQKAMLLSIVLNHGDCVAEQTGRRPLLLLDELAAHLDPVRRHALFARLDSAGGQVWMTGTEAGLFDVAPSSADRWHVAAGDVSRR